MNRPSPGLFKQIAFTLLILLTLSGCRLVSYLKPATPTATSTQTPTQTPTPENCFWNWAYGEGSPEFDNAVIQKLAGEGISATVNSSSYGEVNSCTNTFGAMALDVKVDIRVADFAAQDSLAATSDKVLSLLQDNLSLSQVNNLGNINLTFTTPDGRTCYWDKSLKKCAE